MESVKPRPYAALYYIVAVVCVCSSFYFRGPIGLGLLIVTAPLAMLLAWGLAKLRVPLVLAIAVVSVIVVAGSYLLFAPPSTTTLFRTYLHCDPVPVVRNVQRQNVTWARDPMYFLRFQISPAEVERLVIAARLSPAGDEFATPVRRTVVTMPDWWRPEDIEQPRVWSGIDRCAIELWYDEATETAYLAVFTM